MPLRASNFKSEDLRTIVFLGNLKYVAREWDKIKNFPKVFLCNVSTYLTEQKHNKVYNSYTYHHGSSVPNNLANTECRDGLKVILSVLSPWFG